MSNISDDYAADFFDGNYVVNDDYFNCEGKKSITRFRGKNDPGLRLTPLEIQEKMRAAMYVPESRSALLKSPKLLSCLLAKKLALSLGIKNLPNALIPYENGKPGIFCRDLSEECRISPFIDEGIRETVVNAFFQAPSNFKLLDQTVSSINAGELVILPAGWKGHAILIVFHKNHLYICNKGEEAAINPNTGKAKILAYEIDPTLISIDILFQIDSQSWENSKDASVFFKKTLPSLLSRDGQVIEKRCPLENALQQVGNCSFASTSQALYLVIYLLSDGKTEEECKEICQKILLALRLGYLDQYMYHTDGFNDEFDNLLVIKSALKIIKKLAQFPDVSLSDYANAKLPIYFVDAETSRCLPRPIPNNP